MKAAPALFLNAVFLSSRAALPQRFSQDGRFALPGVPFSKKEERAACRSPLSLPVNRLMRSC